MSLNNAIVGEMSDELFSTWSKSRQALCCDDNSTASDNELPSRAQLTLSEIWRDIRHGRPLVTSRGMTLLHLLCDMAPEVNLGKSQCVYVSRLCDLLDSCDLLDPSECMGPLTKVRDHSGLLPIDTLITRARNAEARCLFGRLLPLVLSQGSLPGADTGRRTAGSSMDILLARASGRAMMRESEELSVIWSRRKSDFQKSSTLAGVLGEINRQGANDFMNATTARWLISLGLPHSLPGHPSADTEASRWTARVVETPGDFFSATVKARAQAFLAVAEHLAPHGAESLERNASDVHHALDRVMSVNPGAPQELSGVLARLEDVQLRLSVNSSGAFSEPDSSPALTHAPAGSSL